MSFFVVGCFNPCFQRQSRACFLSLTVDTRYVVILSACFLSVCVCVLESELVGGSKFRDGHVRPARGPGWCGVRHDAAGALPGVRLLHFAVAESDVHQAQGKERGGGGGEAQEGQRKGGKHRMLDVTHVLRDTLT